MNHSSYQMPSFSFAGLKELQNRLLFSIVVLIVYRIGAHIPLPGLDPERLTALLNQTGSGLMSYFSMLSGGSTGTLFSMGLGPYINVSIAMQMLSYSVPSLEQLKKEGGLGRRKLNQYTRYGTVFVALLQSFIYAYRPVFYGIVTNPSMNYYAVAMVTLVTGTAFLMWLGEQISERGVGQGTSLIIFGGILSGVPRSIIQFIEQIRQGQVSTLNILLVIAMVGIIGIFVVFIERAQRRITVHHPKRQQGRHIYAAQSNHLPLKINNAGIMPTIFASVLMMMPSFLLSFAGWLGMGVKYPILEEVSLMIAPGQPLYMLGLAFLICFFCFFCTALTQNPRETADHLKKSGTFIPGIRPGEQSAQYIDTIMTHLTVIGCIYLLLVVLLPEILVNSFNIPFAFGGTAFLIVIVVVMEIITQIQSLLVSHQYESLVKKARLKGNFPIR